jgi:hypothetical protein
MGYGHEVIERIATVSGNLENSAAPLRFDKNDIVNRVTLTSPLNIILGSEVLLLLPGICGGTSPSQSARGDVATSFHTGWSAAFCPFEKTPECATVSELVFVSASSGKVGI